MSRFFQRNCTFYENCLKQGILDSNDLSPIKNFNFGLLYKKKIKTGFLLEIFSLENNSVRQKWPYGKSQIQSFLFRV